MSEKLTGYALLAVGITLIALAVVSVYLVFSGKQQPVQLFSFSGIGIDLAGSIQLPPDAAQYIKPGSTKQEIVSADMLNSSSNLFAHIILMGFIVSAGFKIGSLGVQLVRVIEVKVKEADKDTKTPAK